MERIIITGGPCCGKTTLLSKLQERLPEATYLEEAAERIILEERSLEETGQNYQGKFPWNQPGPFQHRVIDLTLELEAKAAHQSNLTFQDRSLIDNIAYARLSNLKDVEERARRLGREANYDLAIFCEPFPYQATEVRHEDPEFATKIHTEILLAYREEGIPTLILPATSSTERADQIQQLLT